MSLFGELRRRNVFRVGIAYLLIAWVALQGADFAFDLVGAPDWVIRVLSILAAIGLPAALIFAWVFEMTPEGLKREKDIDRGSSITRETGRRLDRTIIVVLAVAVALLLVDRFRTQPERPVRPAQPEETVADAVAEAGDRSSPEAAEGPSIAVLPFRNMSGNPENEYFSDGLTETLLHMLAQLPDLRVAARTSSFAFKNRDQDVREVAQTLGVDHVLEGSVQRAGDRVRITSQLIRADDGFHVWSQNYDRTLDDIFAIQDEIATDVADALGASLLDGPGRGMQSVATRSTRAYDLFLQGLEQQAIYSYGSLGEAERLFKESLAVDPGFTDAKLALVRNHILSRDTGLIDPGTAQQRATPLLDQVRQEAPDDPTARALELLAMPADDFWMDPTRRDAVVKEMRDLLAVVPGESMLRTTLAGPLANLYGRPEEAVQILQAGLLVDPLSPEIHLRLANVYEGMDDLDAARAALERTMEINPAIPGIYTRLAWLSARENELVEALNLYRRATEVDPQDHELAANVADRLYALGLVEEGDRWLAKCEALAPNAARTLNSRLIRAFAIGDDEALAAQALAILRSDVDGRDGLIGNAVISYVNAMILLGRTDEARATLDELRPGFDDLSNAGDSFDDLSYRFGGMTLLMATGTPDQRRAGADRWEETLRRIGIPLGDLPEVRSFLLTLRGDADAAAKIELEGPLAEPFATEMDSMQRWQSPALRDLAAVPAVAERLAQRREEKALWAERVRAELRKPEWDT